MGSFSEVLQSAGKSLVRLSVISAYVEVELAA